MQANDLELIRLLATGGFAKIYVARDKTSAAADERVAVKVLAKRSGHTLETLVQNEVRVLQALQRKGASFCVLFRAFCETAEFYCIVTEYLTPHVELYQYIQSYMKRQLIPSVAQLKVIIDQLLRGLQEIHDAGIAHCDIKPENIMIDSSTLRIKYIDFGYAHDSRSCASATLANMHDRGTKNYLPPEFRDLDKVSEAKRAEPLSLEALRQADLWSLGMTIFVLATSRSPEYFKKYALSVVPRKFAVRLPLQLSALRSLLQTDPSKRILTVI